jgi:hypothetical protein
MIVRGTPASSALSAPAASALSPTPAASSASAPATPAPFYATSFSVKAIKAEEDLSRILHIWDTRTQALKACTASGSFEKLPRTFTMKNIVYVCLSSCQNLTQKMDVGRDMPFLSNGAVRRTNPTVF